MSDKRQKKSIKVAQRASHLRWEGLEIGADLTQHSPVRVCGWVGVWRHLLWQFEWRDKRNTTTEGQTERQGANIVDSNSSTCIWCKRVIYDGGLSVIEIDVLFLNRVQPVPHMGILLHSFIITLISMWWTYFKSNIKTSNIECTGVGLKW